MKRAFRYDGEEMDQQIAAFVGTSSHGSRRMSRNGNRSTCSSVSRYVKQHQNRLVTENGAFGYRTTMHPLADLNFMVSSLRGRDGEFIVKKFVQAYYQSPKYAVKWLFYLRDIAEGLGERSTFRICLKYLADSHPEMAKAVIELIPEYGRFDDLLVLLDTELREETGRFLKAQLDRDLAARKENRPVSLLAKWLPSTNTSSRETRARAQMLADQFGMKTSEYRKHLSALRACEHVTEVYMSSSRWSEIDYEKVPAKANLNYDAAFAKHDRERRSAWLRKVFLGESRLNGKGIMPYEVVHRFWKNGYGGCALKDDLLAELMWKQILEDGFVNDWGIDDCIVVADGSGSMYANAGGSTSVRAIEICNALAIYFAEQLNGPFHNKAITFSSRPQFIDLDRGTSLKEKLEIMLSHNEFANTNIEAVFDLLLDLAVSHEVPTDEIPRQVLIISDMEFDEANALPVWTGRSMKTNRFTPALFETIENRYHQAGYPMPRLIFWNVCGRTDTIPKVENGQGICLLSGFSQNAMKIAADRSKKDPYESLIQVLDGERYARVERAIEGVMSRERLVE